MFDIFQMPHESTVEHENSVELEDDGANIYRTRSVCTTPRSLTPEPTIVNNKISRLDSVPNLRADTPKKVTHHHDDDDFEDDSSSNSPKTEED